jgi:hypothetical protein
MQRDAKDLVRPWTLAAAGAVALQALILLAMGLPLICTCGHVALWHCDPSGPETSQHLADWYTATHVVHGFGLYLLLWLVVPGLPIAQRFALAIGIEVAWEVIENTPLIVERYRQSALARGYFGDSVVNSVADTLAAAIGFILTWIMPVRASVALVLATELLLGYAIRDNLTLNIIQLIHPSEAISAWQVGG